MLIVRYILLAFLVFLLGCPGTLSLGVSGTLDGDDDDAAGDDDDDDAAGDDDDAAGDDDDAAGDDDDAAGDDDDAAGDDDDAADDDDDDDDDDEPVIPSSCAPSVQPNSPDQVRTYAGSATLTPGTSTGSCTYSWSGCEAIKLFDSSGLVCEVVWDVTGPCIEYDYNWQDQESEVLYDLTFTLDMLETTCTGDESGWIEDRLEDQEWDYRLEWADGSEDLDIFWAYPGDDDYSEWANTTFSADSFGVVTLDYTDVGGWESW